MLSAEQLSIYERLIDVVFLEVNTSCHIHDITLNLSTSSLSLQKTWLEDMYGIWSLLLLLWRCNSDIVLAFSTISFHLRRSCTCSNQFTSFIFFRSFPTSSSHRALGLPAGLPMNGFHLCILFTMLLSGILFVCPNQLNRWALT